MRPALIIGYLLLALFQDNRPRVPTVVYMSLGPAKAALSNAGYQWGRVELERSPVQAGLVIRQQPAGGTIAARTAVVDLWLSKGPD